MASILNISAGRLIIAMSDTNNNNVRENLAYVNGNILTDSQTVTIGNVAAEKTALINDIHAFATGIAQLTTNTLNEVTVTYEAKLG